MKGVWCGSVAKLQVRLALHSSHSFKKTSQKHFEEISLKCRNVWVYFIKKGWGTADVTAKLLCTVDGEIHKDQ